MRWPMPAQMGVDLETAALRVFSNAEGAYGSNVNTLVGSSAFGDEDELADAYEARKSFAYGRDGKAVKNAALLQKALKDVDIAYQNLESVELGVTSVDHYFDTLGGIARAVKPRARRPRKRRSTSATRPAATGKVRTLRDQIALESRSRSLNPKFYEGLLEARPRGRPPDRGACHQHHRLVGHDRPGRPLGLPAPVARPSCWTRRCAAGWPR